METPNNISREYQKYFSSLFKALEEVYEVAKKARAKGFDPKPHPEIEIANDLASLVEGFIGLPGIADRIRELSKITSRERVAFKIAEEIVRGRFGDLGEEKAADLAIRTALAVLTEGVTAAVYSEGIGKVAIKTNIDGSRYLAVYFAGPIRSAGGTEAALTPVIADFVRRLLGLDRYKPTREEIERFIEELRLYEREVGRFQYSVSDEQVRFSLKNIPVEITGTPSDPVEVSSYRDLPRVETNRVRGGALRVINDGIIGRAVKVLAVVEDLGMQGWEWLKDIKEIKGKSSPGFMEEVPAGRPVLCFPSRNGGFRLRYGRSRNTGLAAVGVHPLTMMTLQNFLAGGTQLKIETPGKSGVVMPVDYIEPPVVKLRNGSVVKVSYENIDFVRRETEKILFLGDVLISFGDFLYNNRALLPSGYTEEFWCEELREIIARDFNGSIDEAASKVGVPSAIIKGFLDDPFNNKPSIQEAVLLSRALNIPLHPSYTFFWSNIDVEHLMKVRKWLLSSEVSYEGDLIAKIEGQLIPDIKEVLEEICVPHRITINKKIIIEGSDAHAFALSLGIHSPNNEVSRNLSVLENLSSLSGLIIRDKAPTFIGARVGRPEKAKEREMKPPVHVLFPVGLSGGSQRNLMKAYSKGTIRVELISRICPKCQTATFKKKCSECGSETQIRFVCPKCGRSLSMNECPVCKVEARSFCPQMIFIRGLIDEACQKVGFKPDQVKGVKGLTNKTRTPEPLEKGILRAKYNLSVYKDGTIRFDATNAPLTHFKPSEAGVSVEKLRELGYTQDYLGNPLSNHDQICELKVQDIIIPWKCAEYLVAVANFIDELLQKLYDLPPFYNVSKPQDLVGKLVIGIAPHTCAGVLGRVIGFTKLNVCLAHPFWHSAKRRDCDGDEDSIMLALDAFLNFSREYLPDQIGGIMDSPLFIIRMVVPEEVQRQAHEFDVAGKYPLEFYRESFKGTPAREIINLVDIVKHRFKSESRLQGFMFTIPTSNIEAGNRESAYKTLKRMSDKLNAQLGLAEKIKAVDAKVVAEIVLNTHFIRDISGNLRAFATQSFRCKRCNRRFRRVPLKGVCSECGGELTLTVHRGAIEKYLENAWRLVKKYGMSDYYAQRLVLIGEEINSLFESGKGVKQSNLSFFLNKNN